jgi:hypothetical protein
MSSSEVEAMHWQMGENEMARRVALGLSQRPYADRVQEIGTFELGQAEYAPQEHQRYPLSPAHEQRSLSDHSGMMESGQNLGMAGSQRMGTFQQEQVRHAPPGHQSFHLTLPPAYGHNLGMSDPRQYAFGRRT